MRSGLFRNLLLMLADAVSVSFSWLVAVGGYRLLGGQYDPSIYLSFWPVIPAFLGLNILFRLYHGRLLYPAAPVSPVEEMRRLFGSAVILHVGVIAVLALARQTTESYSRVAIVSAGMLTMFTVQVLRNVLRSVLHRYGVGQIPVAIVGTGDAARQLVRALGADHYVGFHVIGFFEDDQAHVDGVPRLGGLRKVVKKCRRLGVRILFACIDERLFRCQMSSYTEWFTHIEYFPTARVFPVLGAQMVSLDGIGGIEMVNQVRMPALRLEKWVLDKVLSLIAFVLLLPFLFAIGLMVVLTSSGGAFYRHNRLGRGGVPIRIWKFRTMYRDADDRLRRILAENPDAAKEWAARFKLTNDPRVTPLGRWLRKMSLDELPQIFNVLGGSMTLVGPRPIVQDEVRYYGSSYKIFSSVKPGVTGLWQVSGRSDLDYVRRVVLDSYYVLNWSPWLDLWILFRTIGAVLWGKGAR